MSTDIRMQIASHITRGLICLCEGRPLYEVFIIEMVQLQAENAVAGCRVKLLCRSENDYYSSYCCSRCCLRTQFTGCHQTVQLPEFHQSESSIVRVERLSWNLSPASPNSEHTKIRAYLHVGGTGGGDMNFQRTGHLNEPLLSTPAEKGTHSSPGRYECRA